MKSSVTLKNMIRECLDNEDEKLTDWEMEFLDSVWAQAVTRGNELSERQAEIIERIWEKVYG